MSVLDDHAVEISGEGPRTLVLAHGYGCDKSMWRDLVPLLEDGARVVRYDLSGSGAAAPGRYDFDRHASLRGHADDLAAVLDALDAPGPVTLVGHSVSAMTAALAAAARPERVDRVVMVCPSPSFVDDAPYVGGFAREDVLALLDTVDSNYLGWSEQMAPAIMGVPDRPALGERLHASFCRTDPAVARHFARVTFLADHREDVRRFDRPTLVLQCREDVIVPPAVGAWMEAEMPDARLVVLDATGHCPHMSAPRETADAIRAFLEAA